MLFVSRQNNIIDKEVKYVQGQKNHTLSAPTYRHALRKAMSLFLMAPFFAPCQSRGKNAGPGKAPSFRSF